MDKKIKVKKHTGVYFSRNKNKWHACIGYKNKIYNLGRFENQEDAVEVRKTAEKMRGENFENWYKVVKNKTAPK